MPPLAALIPEIVVGVGEAAAVGGEAAAVGGEAAAAGGEAAAAAGGEAAAAGGEAAGSSTMSNIMDGIDVAQNFLPSGPSGPSSNSAPSSPVPFSGEGLINSKEPMGIDYATGGGGGGATGSAAGAGAAGGFGGNFNSLASGADPNNASSLLGIQKQADQQQTLLELAAKLEAIQKETDQFIIQNL